MTPSFSAVSKSCDPPSVSTLPSPLLISDKSLIWWFWHFSKQLIRYTPSLSFASVKFLLGHKIARLSFQRSFAVSLRSMSISHWGLMSLSCAWLWCLPHVARASSRHGWLRLAHKSSFWARSATVSAKRDRTSAERERAKATTPDQKTKRTTLRKSSWKFVFRWYVASLCRVLWQLLIG